MKKLLSIVFAACATTITYAQESKTEMKPATMEQLPMTKEQRDAMKAKKEADLVEAFKRAEISEEQQKKVREIIIEAGIKNKELKNSTLSEEEKKMKKKENDDAKNSKLKELLGEAKFKTFMKAQKEIREANKSVEGM